jgi:anti-sigma-K factor RskA
MNTMNKEAPERQDIEALLPWHAAGTLSRRDADRVERALASDRELARHYELVREELNETIHLNESLGAPSARAMEKLFAAIDAETPIVRKQSFDLAGRISEFLSGFAPRTLAWSAAAAAVAIFLQGAALTTIALKDQAGHSLASLPAAGGTMLVVRFAPQATAADITKFLDAHKATMVGGPKRGSLYTIRLSTTDLARPELVRVIQRMQAESKIVEFIATKE